MINKTNFSFDAVGDWACNPNTVNTVNNIINKNPEFILGLGDYSYQQDANCWFNIVKPIDKIMKISLGNHEIDSFSKLEQFINHYGLSKPFYSFDFLNVHFIALSTEFSVESDMGKDGLVGSSQYKFLVNDLSNAASNPNVHWIIVYFHKPMYASFNRHTAFISFRDTYHPLFQKYKVDLVLQGHNHVYERSYPLTYNNNNSSNPIIYFAGNSTIKKNSNVNDSNYEYVSGRGQIFATVGTAGARPDIPKVKAPYIAVQHNGFGFLNIDIMNNGTKLNAKFYSNDGSVRDEFSVIKPFL
jgi:3',5'-cyclic AMP phosphodiesterase CpdA